WYEAEHEEYVFRGGKYIRLVYALPKLRLLSDGRVHKKDDCLWLRVEPVRWLYDEGAQLLISRTVVTCGPGFTSSNYYDGVFENTAACHFLNTAFAEGLIPSRIREMTAEERKQYEEEMKETAKKRNPYGLTFGQVTEEDIIRGAIESDIAVFLHGPSSEGKSARVKQIDPTCEIIYLRNATPDSLNGRSVYNQSTGEMIDIPPTWYKKVKAKCEQEPDKFHVVFFDEINNALPSIQGMAFNIVLDREVNGLWKLPPNARVVAAGNDMQDSLAANQIAAPFFNRFAHVYIETTTEKWLQWARDHQIHPAIYSFIAYKKGESLRSKYDGVRPNADPRKWEMASKMLYATGRPEMLRALIGEEITDEFVQFCSQPVITLDKVMKGEYTEEEIRALNTSERYATTMGLSQAEEEQLETVRRFVRNLGAEFLAVFDTLRSSR
ncbi:MAG: ATP-binding protein, partial [Firmicutes bacterium]|nr:ATP-binding protein [Bacillota bacterium]